MNNPPLHFTCWVLNQNLIHLHSYPCGLMSKMFRLRGNTHLHMSQTQTHTRPQGIHITIKLRHPLTMAQVHKLEGVET